jgi:hypothetical protein
MASTGIDLVFIYFWCKIIWGLKSNLFQVQIVVDVQQKPMKNLL